MTDDELLQAAKEVSKKAYVPFTGFPVGSAIEMEDGSVYIGCNVENSGFGSSLCAERSAIAAAIADGKRSIAKIAIYSPKLSPALSCGSCRQWIWNFAEGKNIPIITEGEDGKAKIFYIHDLLPHAYSRDRSK